jgi:hypothetical protein
MLIAFAFGGNLKSSRQTEGFYRTATAAGLARCQRGFAGAISRFMMEIHSIHGDISP